jgi:hypothetical protein
VATKKAAPKKKALKTVKKIAEKHNLNPADINSEVYDDRPAIAEVELGLKVLKLVRAGNIDAAVALIESEVRLAHEVEGAA